MSFYKDNPPVANVLIAKTMEGALSFFNEGVGSDSVVLSTGTGTLISLEEKSEYYGNELVVEFVDSGGQTLQSLFNITFPEAEAKSRLSSLDGYYLITYGMGSDVQNWSPPMWYYLNWADYLVNADGLDLTVLKFSPVPSKSAKFNPGAKGSYFSDVHLRSEGVLFAKTDLKGYHKEKDLGVLIPSDGDPAVSDSFVDAIVKVIEEYVGSMYGMPAVFLDGGINKDSTNYIRSLINKYISITYVQDVIFFLDPDERFGVIQDESAPDASPATPSFGGWFSSASKYVKKRNTEPKVYKETIYNTFKPDLIEKLLNSINLTYSSKLKDESYKISGFDSAPNPDASGYCYYLHVNEEYRHLETVTNIESKVYSFLKNLYDVIRVEKDETRKVLEAAKPFIINSTTELKILEDNKVIKSSNTPHVFFGDKKSMSLLKKLLNDGKPKIEVNSSFNLLKFKSTNSVPIISFLKNKISWKPLTDSREYYIKYIRDYLESQVLMYNEESSEDITSLSFDVAAESIYDSISKDSDTFGVAEWAISAKDSLSDLDEFLKFYYNYVMLGTLIAETEVLPSFFINRTDILRNVYVDIFRNPSTYSHIIDPVQVSIHTGTYRLLGYKHRITNNDAKTTYAINKIDLGAKT